MVFLLCWSRHGRLLMWSAETSVSANLKVTLSREKRSAATQLKEIDNQFDNQKQNM
jgi:hypothetical protein